MDRHTHHYGLLAGMGAGTAAVLVCGLFLLSVWHRVSGEVATALGVVVWAFAGLLIAAAAYVVLFLALRLRHHLTHPETLTWRAVRHEPAQARLLPAETPALPAPEHLAVLPPPSADTTWHLNDLDPATERNRP